MLNSSLYTSYEHERHGVGDVATTSQGLDDPESEIIEAQYNDVIDRNNEGGGDDGLAKKGREGPDFLARWHFKASLGVPGIYRD